MTKWFFLLSALSILTFACKKGTDSQEPENPSSARIKSMIYTDFTTGDTIGWFKYQYDAQGRVIELSIQTSPVGEAFVHKYEYYPQSVFDNITVAQNTHWGRNIYTLDAAGFAVSELHVGYGMPGDSSILSTVVSKYDAEGYRIEVNTYLSGDTVTDKWKIVQGNRVSLDIWYTFGYADSLTETYSYFSNTANTLGYVNQGMNFMGKSNVNLLKSSAISSPIPQSASYSYTFDSRNRVIARKVRGSGIESNSCDLEVTYY